MSIGKCVSCNLYIFTYCIYVAAPSRVITACAGVQITITLSEQHTSDRIRSTLALSLLPRNFPLFEMALFFTYEGGVPVVVLLLYSCVVMLLVD